MRRIIGSSALISSFLLVTACSISDDENNDNQSEKTKPTEKEQNEVNHPPDEIVPPEETDEISVKWNREVYDDLIVSIPTAHVGESHFTLDMHLTNDSDENTYQMFPEEGNIQTSEQEGDFILSESTVFPDVLDSGDYQGQFVWEFHNGIDNPDSLTMDWVIYNITSKDVLDTETVFFDLEQILNYEE